MPTTYCQNTDVYRATGLTSATISTTDVDAFIYEAEEWIDDWFDTTFSTRSVTETRDGTGTRDMFLGWYPKVFQDAAPVLTITALAIDGVSVTPAKVYVYPESGRIILKDNAEVTTFTATKPQQVVVTYSYGCASVPKVIKQLTTMVAGIHALIEQIGGTWDDVTSYNLPEFSANKGEPYANIRETITKLDARLKEILDRQRPTIHIG